MTDAMLIYAAETGAIVRIQWGLILVLGVLMVGVLMVNFRLRARCGRVARAYKGLLAKLVAAEKECNRQEQIRRRTEKALVKARADA